VLIDHDSATDTSRIPLQRCCRTVAGLSGAVRLSAGRAGRSGHSGKIEKRAFQTVNPTP
jgi:hypothetical protein